MAPPPRALPLLPAAGFVLVWSSGYIAGPYGVTGMTPLMLVAVRFAVATVLVAVLARVLPRPAADQPGRRGADRAGAGS